MKIAFRIFSYITQYPGIATAQLSFAILGTLLLLVFPQMSKMMVENVMDNDTLSLALKKEKIVLYLGIALGSFILKELFSHLRIITNNYFEQAAIFDLRSKLYNKLQRLPIPWFDERRTGDIMTRVAEDVPQMERLLIDGVEQGLVAIIQILVVIGFLFYHDVWAALAALSPVPLLFIGAICYTKNARHRYREVRKFTADMNALLVDNVAGIRQIKSYAAEVRQHTRFEKAATKVKKASLKVMKAWAIYSPSMSFANSLGYVAVLGISAWRITEGQMAIPTFVAFMAIIWALYDPILRIHQLNQMTQSSIAAAERVFSILDEDDEIHSTDGNILKTPITGHVTYQNINFQYNKNTPIISNISLEAKAGQTIALVGTTGAGKSTLVNLLTRFYEYDSGEICIDGLPIHQLNKNSLRDQIGYVTQEPFLFNGTIKDNLKLAKPNASETEMWTALKAANAHLFVNAYQDKLNTEIGERGVKLSGGEKQRISIAIALLKNPPILILDEATSSVDSQTEKLIQEALDHLLTTRTAFVIAHRLSTIQNADYIYVLEKGEVIESGDHYSLMKSHGKYAELLKNNKNNPPE